MIHHRSRVEASAEEVFAWHLRPGAFWRLIPPWEQVRLVSKEVTPDQVGSELVLKTKIGPFWKLWVVRHQEFVHGKSFTDVQVKGPFRFWKHIHRILPIDENACEIEDEIHFSLPINLARSWVEKRLKRMLQWRHETLLHDFQVQARYPKQNLRILVSGSTGLVGRELIPFLRTAGHEVVRLVRKKREGEKDVISWNPQKGKFYKGDFEGFDAVIHLAGKNIASGVWTAKIKKELFVSRARDTWLLSQILLRLKSPPKTLMCASAVGIYGDRGEESLTENSLPGTGFLADLCKKWEGATKSVEDQRIRRVHTRFGLIFSARGGLLARMLPVFRLGFGAILGSGKQYMSWICLDDVVYALYHVLREGRLEEGVNVTSPQPETNREFSKQLAEVLNRPLVFRIGEKPLRMVFKEMAEEMFLSSTKAYPEKLQDSGFSFFYPNLKSTFKRLLLN